MLKVIIKDYYIFSKAFSKYKPPLMGLYNYGKVHGMNRAHIEYQTKDKKTRRLTGSYSI
jgi:hypothetical protein